MKSKRNSYYILVAKLPLLILLLLASLIYAQAQNNKLLYAIDDCGAKGSGFIKENSMCDVKVVLEDKMCFAPIASGNNIARLNQEALLAYIKQVFPNEADSGIGVLDWEGVAFDVLIVQPDTNRYFKQVINEFLIALQLAKRTRPNVEWGYYGIPFKQGNYKNKADWIEANKKIEPLLRACDIFCPNSYGYSPTDLGNDGDVRESIRLGIAYHKEVYPFVWHRFNGNSQNEYVLELIPESMFVKYVVGILNQQYENRKVDGVIWWGQDTYFYDHNDKALLKEALDRASFMKHYDEVIINYSRGIVNTIHE